MRAWSAPLRDEHVLEVLARSTARATVHVTLVAMLELEPRAIEELGVQAAPVVDDDYDATVRRQCTRAGDEHAHDAVDVVIDRRARRATRGGADLCVAPVGEPEQLVGVP